MDAGGEQVACLYRRIDHTAGHTCGGALMITMVSHQRVVPIAASVADMREDILPDVCKAASKCRRPDCNDRSAISADPSAARTCAPNYVSGARNSGSATGHSTRIIFFFLYSREVEAIETVYDRSKLLDRPKIVQQLRPAV